MTDHPFGISPRDEACAEQRAAMAVFATGAASFHLTLLEEGVDRSEATHLTGNFIHTCLTKDQQ
jgi:hypothetical protein